MGIKRYIRDHEKLMYVLAAIYRAFGFNRISGAFKLNMKSGGVFMQHSCIRNKGQNNQLRIGKGCRIYNSRIQFFGDNNNVKIDRDCVLKNVDIWISDGGTVEIGHNTHFTGQIHIACIEGKKVKIGDECLFSNSIVFRTGDSHSILDDKGNRTNHAKDIIVGNHCWIGQQVIVLKGSSIGAGSVVGTRALVTGKYFQNNSMIVGSPAKVVKENISWDPRTL